MKDGESVQLLAAGEEGYQSSNYYYDNRDRELIWEEKVVCAIQCTMAGEAFFEDSDGRRLVGPGKAMLFTHRDQSRYGYPEEATDVYRLRYLNFSPGMGLLELFNQIRKEFGSVVSLSSQSGAGRLFNEIYAGFQASSIPSRWQETELLFQLLLAIMREQISTTIEVDPIAKAYDFLRNKFRTAINLKDASSHCGISREHLCRVFHERYGVSPSRFLRDLRMQHGRSMVLLTSMTIEDIAVRCGYVHANAFARAYRKEFGCSPSISRSRGIGKRHSAVESADSKHAMSVRQEALVPDLTT